MNISQRLRTCARHTGLDAVIELLNEAADEIDALQARTAIQQAESEPDEPAAWRCFDGEGDFEYRTDEPSDETRSWSARYNRKWEPLYTHHAPGVPEGYVLVPIVPTEEMLAAGDAEDHWHTELIYAAMLAASPAQKGGE